MVGARFVQNCSLNLEAVASDLDEYKTTCRIQRFFPDAVNLWQPGTCLSKTEIFSELEWRSSSAESNPCDHNSWPVQAAASLVPDQTKAAALVTSSWDSNFNGVRSVRETRHSFSAFFRRSRARSRSLEEAIVRLGRITISLKT